MVDGARQPIEVFFSYSRKDKELRDELDTHLALLKRRGVTTWHDCQIVAGSEWEEEINRRIKTADIVLLLISSDFIASNYCYEKELPDILQRHEAREAFVIPVLLRPVAGWKQSPFAKLQICPAGGLPVTQWKDRDAAFVDVAESIEEAVNKLLEQRDRQRQEQEQRAQEKLKQEQLRVEAIRQRQLKEARREEQAKEQARLAEQARIREAEQKAEKQRQELIRSQQAQQAAAEKARRAEEEARRSLETQRVQEAKRVEEARQAEQHRQAIHAMRSQYIDNPQPPEVDRNRRKVMTWLGLGSAGMFVAGLAGQEALRRGRLNWQPFDFEVATVNAKGQESPRQRKQGQLFVEDLGNGVTLEMVSISSGAFQMGSPTTERGRRDDESPQHPVNVSAFSIGRYAVTQAQYEAIMGKNPSYFKGAKRPVEQVSWNDAQEFCKRLSQKTGRKYRLPSEAEWEYACRAETTTPFHLGETITSALAAYDGTYTYRSEPEGEHRKQTTDVGIFPANTFGLCDMHGNVWEWCEDIYHETYEGAPKAGSAWNVGEESDRRLLRGGSWLNNPAFCRSAIRDNGTLDNRSSGTGFRVVCSSARA